MATLWWLPPLQVVDAVGQLLDRDGHRRRRVTPHRIRHRDVHRRVLDDRRDRQFEHRMPALRPDDAAREPDAAEIAVVRVRELDRRVAEHGIVDPRLHPLDLVAGVDAPDIAVLPAHGEGDLGAALDRLRRGVVGGGGLQEAVRRRPDLHGPFFDRGRLRLRRRRGARGGAGWRGHVPGVGAADDLHDPLRHGGRSRAIGLDHLDALHLHLRGGRLVVDAGREALQVERRPGQRGIGGLAELEPSAGARVLDGVRVGGCQRRAGGWQRPGLLAGAGTDGESDHHAGREKGGLAHGHTSMSVKPCS